MISEPAIRELVRLLGPRGVLREAQDLTLYEYDGGVDKHRPDVVVFPRSAADVVEIVRIANRYNVPFVGRGAGTGLSGGAIPREGGALRNGRELSCTAFDKLQQVSRFINTPAASCATN